MADETIDIEVKATTDMSDVESLQQAISELNESIVDLTVAIDDSSIDDTIDKKEELSEDTEFTVNSDDSGIDDALEKKKELEQDVEVEVSADVTDFEALSSGLAGIGMSKFGMEAIETAGSISDSWNRLELTFGSVTPQMKKSISETATATGRSGALTRGFFNQMGIAGIKNEKIISQSMEAISGKAYQTGNDFGTLGSQVQKMVLTGKILKKSLAGMGVSMGALADAMGTTEDEATEMFESLSAEERLEVFTKAMGDGTKANEMYKNSFEGIKTKAKAEFDGLVGAIGTPLLSVVIPVLTTAKDVFSMFTDVFKSLPAPIQSGISSIVGMGLAVGTFASMIPIFVKACGGIGNGFKTLSKIGMIIPGINTHLMSFSNTLKTALGKSPLGRAIASLFKIELETAQIKAETEVIDKTAKSTKVTGGMQKQALAVHSVNQGATEVGVAGEEGYVAGATEEAGAGGLQAVATGMWAMLPAIAQIAIVVAIIIAIIGALVAEVILIVKGIQLLIQAMDFGSVDFSKTIKGLKQLGSAVMEIGKIMLAMTFTALISGVYNLMTLGGLANPIQMVKSTIKNTIKALNEIGGFGTVDKSVVENLKKISESVKAVGDVMGSMADTSWTVMMGNLMTLGGLFGNFQSLMNQAKTDISNAIKTINELELGEINAQKAEQLKKVSEALKAFGDAMSGLGDIQWTEFMNGINPFTNINQALVSAKQDLITASNSLKEYSGLQAPPKDVGQKIKSVSDALTSVSEALNKMSEIGWTEGTNWLNPLVNLSGSLSSAKADIWSASQKLAEMSAMPSIPTTVSEKLKTLRSSLSTTVNTFKALETMDSAVFDLNFLRNIANSMTTAKTDIVKVSKIIASMGNEMSPIPEGLGGQLQRITWVSNGVVNAVRSLNSLNGMEIDVGAISTKIQNAKQVIIKASEQFSSISASASTIDAEVGAKVQMVTQIARNVVNAINTLISLPVVPEDIGTRIDQAVNSIKTAIDKLNTLSNSTVNGNISSILTTVTNTLNNLRATLSSMGGGFASSSVGIGTGIVTGIRSGMSGLTSAVTGIVSASLSASASRGWTGGARIGLSIMGGFKSAFNLHTTMSTELSYTLQAIHNASQQYHGAGEQLGRSVVQGFRLGINTGSPGDVYNTMEDELNYVKYLIPSYNSTMKDMSADLGTSVVSGFSQNSTLQMPQTSNTSQGIVNTTTSSPVININVEGNINDENTMDKLVERLTRAITWSNAMGNRSV